VSTSLDPNAVSYIGPPCDAAGMSPHANLPPDSPPSCAYVEEVRDTLNFLNIRVSR
jgi:hypothetical protein